LVTQTEYNLLSHFLIAEEASRYMMKQLNRLDLISGTAYDKGDTVLPACIFFCFSPEGLRRFKV
jgi:hypothetical protein